MDAGDLLFLASAIGLASLGVLAVLAPLLRARSATEGPADLAIYRDQLAEVERDLARGTLNAAEAEQVRLEVQRRLLAADRERPRSPGRTPRAARLAAAILVVGIGGGAAGLYGWIGSPGYADLPLAERAVLAEEWRAARPAQSEAERRAAPSLPEPREIAPDFAETMTELRRILEQRPDDQRGFRLLARHEAEIGNLVAARRAQDRVVALAGEAASAEDWSSAGELRMRAAGGLVTAEAEQAFDRALALDPRDGRALYYRGLAFSQAGQFDRTLEIWAALLEQGPPDAPWQGPIRARIRDVAEMAGMRYQPPPLEGPDEDAMRSAARMSPEKRTDMIRGMVEGLSERLASEGGPAQDWARLISALRVLGEGERSAAIAQEARGVFAASPESMALIEEAASAPERAE